MDRLTRFLLENMGGGMPNHVAFIMDGNRRFARLKGARTLEGHQQGFASLMEILRWCSQLKIRHVTAYAFSVDNFNRPEEEVAGLMSLALEKFRELLEKRDDLRWHGIRIQVLGELEMLSQELQEVIRKLMEATKDCKEGCLNICFPYTSRHEMCGAIRALSEKVLQGALDPSEIDEELVDQHLYTKNNPPLDVVVRTSGEKRLSDFLLWQTSSAQMEFKEVLWPEIGRADLIETVLMFKINNLPGLHAIPQRLSLRLLWLFKWLHKLLGSLSASLFSSPFSPLLS